MAYTTAQMVAATDALVAAIHGIHSDVAHAWATAEQGVNYNILGVTYRDATGQHLYKYSSWAQGAEAAAHLIATSQYYGGIRAALSQDSQHQAAAIIASPWNHPYYSTGAGASLLRQIAAAHPSTSTSQMEVAITGPTYIYDSNGNNTGKQITRATYAVGPKRLVRGLWQYPVIPHPGWWIRPTRYTRFF